MVAIKRAPKKETSAPIITVPMAKVKLNDPEFHPQPREVETKDGSKVFTVDPGLNAQIEIVDDHGDGTHDGVKFYQNFKLKWNEDGEFWEMRDGTSFGALLKARYGNDFDFETEEDFDLDVNDFDGFIFMCKVVPKKNPHTGQESGSMCHHETIMAVPDPKRKKKVKKAKPSGPVRDEIDLTPEALAKMNKALG